VAGADSTVRVRIIGNAKSLQDASRDSEKAVGGIGKAAKAAGGIIAGAFAVDAIVDFGQRALEEGDRVGDATLRLQQQLGDLSQPIIDAAENFQELGLSEGDLLELTGRIADMAEAAGIADRDLGPMATTVAETAAALALIGNNDSATIVDLIGKAAGGATKPLKELGINLGDAEVEARALADTGKRTADELTEGELATARLMLIMEKLAPRVADVTGAEADLETKQAELDAKFETFTGNVGEALDGPLTELLTWLIDTGEAAGAAAGALRAVDNAIDKVGGEAQAQIDTLRELLNILAQIARFLPGGGALNLGSQVFGTGGGGVGSTGGGTAQSPDRVEIHVQGGSPEVIEQAVRNAVHTITGRSGPLE
jgi:hypothetical protein